MTVADAVARLMTIGQQFGPDTEIGFYMQHEKFFAVDYDLAIVARRIPDDILISHETDVTLENLPMKNVCIIGFADELSGATDLPRLRSVK